MLMFLIKIFQRIKLSESWKSSALSKKLTFAAGRTCENPSCPSVQRGGRAPSQTELQRSVTGILKGITEYDL